MRQSLISMRELQLSLQCFKKTKFTSDFWIESMLPEFREASLSVILHPISLKPSKIPYVRIWGI